MGGAPDWVVIAVFVVLTGTTGMFTGAAVATGEEIGWRGFLVPELAKVLPFTGVALVSGLIWASWHYPITAVVYFAQAWLRLKTDSVWPPIFLHASHNLWMQSIFTPLTSDREYTKWIAGDLGLAFVIVAAVVATAFRLKRGAISTKQVVPQPV